MEEVNWLPSLISTGALGLVWYDMRRCRAEMEEKTKGMKEEVKLLKERLPKHFFEEFEDEFMTKEEHNQLCKIRSLEFTQALKDSIADLKDQLFPEIRKIHDAIKASNGNSKP